MKNVLLLLSLIVLTLSSFGATESLAQSDPVKVGYICQGDPLPAGYSIVRVVVAPPTAGGQCGLNPATLQWIPTLFIEKTKSGLVVCGSSLALLGYTLHTLDYVVAAVAPAPCPGIPGQEGWRIEELAKVNTVCRLSNVIGTQFVVPYGYVVTGIDDLHPGTTCPGPVITIRVPGLREVVCSNIGGIAPFGIPLGYSIISQTFSLACPGSGMNAFEIERISKPSKLFNGISYDLLPSSCAIEPFIKSTSFDTETFVQFLNDSSQTVSVYWIDYNGLRVLYNHLPAGQSYVQATFVTHPWMVVSSSGDCLGIYFPTSDSTRVWIR